MKITLRDMYGALPQVKADVHTLNPWVIVTLAVMFCSACIVLSTAVRLYLW
jgi:hypothetical protein